MSDAIERAAKVIRAAIERQADVVANGMHLDVQGVITPHWIAEALATNGLLAPATLREEWGTYDPADRFMWGRNYFRADSEEAARDKAHAFGYEVHRRLVTDWFPADAVNRAEGDGRADQ